MQTHVLSDYESLSEAAASVVAERVREKPEAVFLLPTGVTPLGMYRRLVGLMTGRGSLSPRRPSFNLDEYLGLPPDHPASYHVYMEGNFYALVRRRRPGPEAECERYEAAIREAGGVDLCVLGIGRNGHIGFNEPGAPFDSRTRVVRLAESTRRVNAADFEGNRAPERAITVGMAAIFEAREVLLLASGAKRPALSRRR